MESSDLRKRDHKWLADFLHAFADGSGPPKSLPW
jgi:hypothetical protein